MEMLRSSRVAGKLFVLVVIAVFCGLASACGGTPKSEAEAPPPADYGGEGAEQASDGPAKADYDGPATPSEKPIKVVLRVSGSEGGAYKGWHWTEENWEGSLFGHTDKPDFKEILGPEPKDYELSLGDGVQRAPDGDWEWDEIWVDIEKAKRGGQDWEGQMYAELLVDGQQVDCMDTDPFEGFTLSWSPEDWDGGFLDKVNCED